MMVTARHSAAALAVAAVVLIVPSSSSSGGAPPRRLSSCGAIELGRNCTSSLGDLIDVCVLNVSVAAGASCALVCDTSKAPTDYRVSTVDEEANEAMALEVEQARARNCPTAQQDTCPPGELCGEQGMCVVAGDDGRECRDMCDTSYEPEDYTKGTTEGAASTVEDMRYSFLPGFSDCDNWFLTIFLYFLAICLIGCLAVGIAMAAGFIPMPVRNAGGGRNKRGLSQQRFDPVLDVSPGGGAEMRAPMVDGPPFPTPETRVAVGQGGMEFERFRAAEAQQQMMSMAQPGVMQSVQPPDFTTPYQGHAEYGMHAPYTPTPSRPPAVMQHQVQMPAQQGQPITYMQPQAQMAQTPVQQQGYLPTALTQLVSPQYQHVVPPVYQQVPSQGMNPMSTQPPSAFQTGSMQTGSMQLPPQGSYYYR